MADDKKIIFSMVGVTKVVPPNRKILNNVYLSFYYGAKIGILGLNGAGKSTLLKIIAGLEPTSSGEVTFSPGYSVGYLEQEPKLDEEKTVIEIVREGAQESVDLINAYEEINNQFGLPEVYENPEKMEKLMDKQGKLQDKIDAVGAWDLDSKLERAMASLNCPDSDTKISVLSGGERRRVALVRLLIQEPDILLLDEPTNHLDAEAVMWLEHHLAEYKGTVIAVTHDRYFLDNVAGWILELDRGEGIPWQGNYSSWLEQKSNRMANEEKQESKRQKALRQELDWVRQGAKGRQTKSKARLKNYDAMLNADVKEQEAKLEIFIPPGPRLGNEVIEAINVKKAFGEKLLYEDLNFKLPPAGIVGIIGPNGAGKSTIFKMIMDEVTPDEGKFNTGQTVKISYVDQSHANLDPNKTVFEVLSGGHDIIELGGRSINARAYCGKFNFTGNDQSKKVGVLSGGERNRLHLAMSLKQEANVILLDEPTNDIDVNTLRALEDALLEFAGCCVIISHDRWFLDRVCTHILAFEGDSQVHYFEGDFSDYEINKKKRLGDNPPGKFRYKKLMK